MDEKLGINRCLHCGGEGVLVGRKKIRVECKKCGARGPVKPFRSQAIAAWNMNSDEGKSV